MRTLISTSLMLALAATSAFAAGKAAVENKQLQEEVRKVEAAMPRKAPAQPFYCLPLATNFTTLAISSAVSS